MYIGRQYAGLVTEYINSQTIKDGIYAVDCRDIILCMDINTPEKASSTENPVSLTDRINDVLMPFALHTPKTFDKMDGHSQDSQNDIPEAHTTVTECKAEQSVSIERGSSSNKPPHKKVIPSK